MAGALLLGACADMDITNTNAPTVDELTESPTKAAMALAATGIFARTFNNVGTEIAFYALYGREGYNLQGNDPRETGEQIRGPQDPTGRNSGIWTGLYSTIRTVNTYLTALPEATGMTDAERRASAGFAKTMKAWQIYRLAVRTGELGIPLDVDRPITAEPAPFVPFADALAAASALMDEARDDLQAAGGIDFPFDVAPGYDGFDKPATFVLFNRALAAKILVARATFVDCASCWTEASAAIDASFVTTAGLPESLGDGVYYAYSSAANEPSNPITDPLNSNQYWVHPSLITGAQERTNGMPDLRLTTKVIDVGRVRELNGLSSSYKPILYNDPANPEDADLGAWIPWITNEELLLLRAEIRWNTGNRPGAIDDINLIREHAGGLPPTSVTAASSDDEFITELLYNRLYSLMWSQGTRWIDARRYDRLDTLPIDRDGDQVFENMLVPADECSARGLSVPCQPLTTQ
ncbi:MAG TPA: RagB/SusD family nutrient uptake outer membrane protein [Longimicrobiales bacterium]